MRLKEVRQLGDFSKRKGSNEHLIRERVEDKGQMEQITAADPHLSRKAYLTARPQVLKRELSASQITPQLA